MNQPYLAKGTILRNKKTKEFAKVINYKGSNAYACSKIYAGGEGWYYFTVFKNNNWELTDLDEATAKLIMAL